MQYHSHKLNSVSHSHIIERTDPITGDSVKENDRVVFCAVCKSCFLEGSWKYMNEEHCGQSQTLDSVPSIPLKLIAKKNNTQLITELLSTEVDYGFVIASITFPFFISLFVISILNGKDIEISFGFTLLAGGLGGLFSSIASSTTQFRKITGNKQYDVRIFKNYIELGTQHFNMNEIRQIKYQRETYVEYTEEREYYSSLVPSILIYFDNGSLIKTDLPTGDYEKIGVFLKGLEKVSYFKEVFFYSENKDEYEIMQNIQLNSNGHIVVGEPARLFHNF
jgi:hypothetical protein